VSDAYAVLELPPDADEAEVRRRYLELVRQFPPDQAPEKFAAIRAAYEEVRNPERRLAARLFAAGTRDSLEAIAAELRNRLTAGRFPLDVLVALADQP
jgi:curved DNA-binding protein CbpA